MRRIFDKSLWPPEKTLNGQLVGIGENQEMQGVLLLVDENAGTGDLLRAELELQGCTVHTLTHGAEAVDIAP